LAFEMPGTGSGLVGEAAAGAPSAGAYPAASYPAVAGATQAAAPPAGTAAAAPVLPQPAAGGGLAGPSPPSPIHELAAHSATAPANAYINPLPGDAQIGRTDMGVDVDLKPGEPIVAPGNSRVLGVAQNWYSGQPYVALQLLDGPMKGHNYYVAEQINVAVTAGQVVRQGQPIAHYAASGTGIEIGWAGQNWEQTLAQAEGNTGDASHANSPAGRSFSDFLTSLSKPAAGSASVGAPAAAVSTPSNAVSVSAAGSEAPAVAAQAQGGAAAGAPVGAGSAASVSPESPPASATAGFQAVERQATPAARHTVQFIPAVQPPASSPVAGAPGLVGSPTGQPVVEQIPSQVQVGQAGTGGLAEQLVGQVPPAGGVISVSSSLLTGGQETFAAHLAQLTGLDPRVVAAWELAEESGGAAQGRQAASNFDWLNIGYFDSGTGQIAFDKAFGDPITAAEQTAKFLKGTWGGASSSIRAILSSVGHSPEQQMMAIANSDWASSHYGGGANLRGTYDELGDLKVQTSPPANVPS
jgi:hypothetical protein